MTTMSCTKEKHKTSVSSRHFVMKLSCNQSHFKVGLFSRASDIHLYQTRDMFSLLCIFLMYQLTDLLSTLFNRTLFGMLAECAAVSRLLQAACTGFEARLAEEGACSRVTALERQLREKLKEAMQLQAGWDAQKVQLNSR